MALAGGRSYDISAGARNSARKFRTIEMVYCAPVDAMRGRGTRVWKAVEIGRRADPKKVFIIKDTWIDSDRTREGDVMTQILQDATSDTHRAALEKIFLTVVCHGDVQWHGHTSKTRHLDEFKLFATQLAPQDSQRHESDSFRTRQTTGTCADRAFSRNAADEEKRPEYLIQYHAKTQYRIVFEEVGTPLHGLTSPGKIFEALKTISQGVSALSRSLDSF